jgi:hypothetical protein
MFLGAFSLDRRRGKVRCCLLLPAAAQHPRRSRPVRLLPAFLPLSHEALQLMDLPPFGFARVPMRLVLSERNFHKLNVFFIRACSFPIRQSLPLPRGSLLLVLIQWIAS